jgi:hypothetical protein
LRFLTEVAGLLVGVLGAVSYTATAVGESSSRWRRVSGWAMGGSALMARFSERMDTEVVQRLWAAIARGGFATDAAAKAGTYPVGTDRRVFWIDWLAAGGARKTAPQ